MQTIESCLKRDGDQCPFCKGEKIVTTYNGSITGQNMAVIGVCDTCKRQWREQYALASIQEILPEQVAAA